jgi:hypothetical protein
VIFVLPPLRLHHNPSSITQTQCIVPYLLPFSPVSFLVPRSTFKVASIRIRFIARAARVPNFRKFECLDEAEAVCDVSFMTSGKAINDFLLYIAFMFGERLLSLAFVVSRLFRRPSDDSCRDHIGSKIDKDFRS